MDQLTPVRRSLTASEKQALRSRIRAYSAEGRRVAKVSLPIGVVVILVLWMWTLVASDAPRLVITAFWLIVGTVIALWVRRDLGRHAGQLQEMARSLESALARDEAEVYDVHARAFAELEEVEDEGACYE